ANEAFTFGFASLVVNERDEMYASLGVTSPQVTVASVTGTDRVARFLGLASEPSSKTATLQPGQPILSS
ncbi:MAG: hypothetical protein HY647_03705, partial [Acidobacteria bacterium]|nr:hypothetical protein [Acidobacteriota bacterium]